MNDVLDLEMRRKIFSLIQKNPGLHLSKLADMLSKRLSLIEYHINQMEHFGLITSVKEKGYIRYYIKGEIGSQDKKILPFLRQETSLRIILFLLNHPHSRHRDILGEVHVARSTLTYHLQKLVQNGIVEVNISDEESTFVVANSKVVTCLLIQYKPYNVFESFKDVWVDLQVD